MLTVEDIGYVRLHDFEMDYSTTTYIFFSTLSLLHIDDDDYNDSVVVWICRSIVWRVGLMAVSCTVRARRGWTPCDRSATERSSRATLPACRPAITTASRSSPLPLLTSWKWPIPKRCCVTIYLNLFNITRALFFMQFTLFKGEMCQNCRGKVNFLSKFWVFT